jgi:hypothetical protein
MLFRKLKKPLDFTPSVLKMFAGKSIEGGRPFRVGRALFSLV